MQVAFVNLSPPMYEGLLANHAGTGPTEAAIFQSLRLCDSALKTTNRISAARQGDGGPYSFAFR